MTVYRYYILPEDMCSISVVDKCTFEVICSILLCPFCVDSATFWEDIVIDVDISSEKEAVVIVFVSSGKSGQRGGGSPVALIESVNSMYAN